MTLTEQEKAWLETRKNLCGRCNKRRYCRTGKRHGYNTEECRYWELFSPGIGFTILPYNDYKDAAAFEARVARELTNPIGDYMPICTPEDCDFRKQRNCRECRLMHARIAVETHMEQETRKC